MIGKRHFVEEKGRMPHSRIKAIALLSLAGFVLGVMAITLHHHDKAFLLPGCSLCKVKTSFSGTVSKIKADSAPAPAVLCLSLTVILLGVSRILSERNFGFIDSQNNETYPNKAPPSIF
jgi:hypothetical protein